MATREELVAQARQMGVVRGESAASWYWDFGRMSGGQSNVEQACERFLEGYEKGDPEVLDTLPGAPLSGEWADELTPSTLLAELGVRETANALEANGDLIDAFEEGFYQASQDAIVAEARRQLGLPTLEEARRIAEARGYSGDAAAVDAAL